MADKRRIRIEHLTYWMCLMCDVSEQMHDDICLPYKFMTCVELELFELLKLTLG